MATLLTNVAKDLKSQTRAALEAELGRSLRDDERVKIIASGPDEDPTPEERRAAVQRLEKHFERMDEKTKDVPEEEKEEILLEAMRSVRPGYQEIR